MSARTGPAHVLAAWILVLAVVGVGCTAAQGTGDEQTERAHEDEPTGEQAEQADDPREVVIAQSGQGTPFAPVYLARSEGFFADEGLEVGEIASLGGGVDAALLAGDVDFALTGINSVVSQHAEGITGAVAVDKFIDPTARQIIVSEELLAEAGVGPHDPLPERLAALDGATVGVLVGTGVENIALHLIRQHGGIDAAGLDVIQFPSGPGAMLGALGRRIDAFMWNPPFGPLAERQGVGRPLALVTEMGEYDFPELVLTTRRELAEGDPEVVAAVTRAIHRGKTFMNDHPEEAIAALVPAFEGSDEELLRSTFELLLPVVPIGEGFDPAQWERLFALMREIGELDAELDASEDELWTNEFIAPDDR